MNPVRAGLLKNEDPLCAYPWSSLCWYAAAREHRPGWMQVGRLIGAHGIGEDTAASRTEFQRRMETRRADPAEEEALQAIRQGWYFGSEQFRDELMERIDGSLGEHHSGKLHQQGSRARASRIVTEELNRLGWTGQELALRRKTDPQKLAIAARLRKETTLPVKEIAVLLSLGTSKSAHATLHRFVRHGTSSPPTVPSATGELGL